jgi:hypothetical protein
MDTTDSAWHILDNLFSPDEVQAHPLDLDLWDPMVFSDTGGLQSFANTNNNNIIATPKSIQNLVANTQESSPNPDSETAPTIQPDPLIYTLPLEYLNVVQDIKKDAKELQDRRVIELSFRPLLTNDRLREVKRYSSLPKPKRTD